MSIFTKATMIFKLFGAKKLLNDATMNSISNEVANIQSEVDELKEAVVQNDKAEVVDALGDIMMFCLQTAYRLDVNMQPIMEDIINSQYSKLCSTPEDVLLTRDYYSSINVETYAIQHGAYTIVKSLGNQTGSDGKEYPNDKVLKNQRTFKAPQSK